MVEGMWVEGAVWRGWEGIQVERARYLGRISTQG